MNKTLKKILIFILALIVVVLVFFALQIMIPRQSSGPALTSPTVSASPTTTPSPSETASPSPSLSPSPSSSPTDTGTLIREDTPDGVTYTVTVPGSYVTYSLGVDEKIFKYDGDKGGQKFASLKNAGEYLQVSFIPGAKAAVLAPSFLDTLLSYTNFEQSGENYIDGTKISGETVTADDGKTQLTSWLVDTDKGVLAVVASTSLADQAAQWQELDKLLSTLTIKE